MAETAPWPEGAIPHPCTVHAQSFGSTACQSFGISIKTASAGPVAMSSLHLVEVTVFSCACACLDDVFHYQDFREHLTIPDCSTCRPCSLLSTNPMYFGLMAGYPLIAAAAVFSVTPN